MKELSETGATWTPPAAMSVSDQIRALDKAGYPRAEIARRLGKRYQHVRNVLEGDKTRGGSPREAAPVARDEPGFAAGESRYFRLEVAPDGTVVIPLAVREAWGWQAGGVVVGRLVGKDFGLVDGLTSARRARDMFQSLGLGSSESLADSLIADRRREAAREAEEYK